MICSKISGGKSRPYIRLYLKRWARLNSDLKQTSMKYKYLLCLALFHLPLAVFAELRPHALFSDHCVLQQSENVPIWGSASPNEQVTVEFRGNRVATQASTDGDWTVHLPSGGAGGPFQLQIEGETNKRQIEDVWVGEVWLASGQSNMERQLGPRHRQQPIDNGMAEAAKADYPRLRMFIVPQVASSEPQDSVEGQWIVCSPETANDFSAVAFFFARDLLARYDLPIGVIHSSWGGTPAEAWTSEEAVTAFPHHKNTIEAWEAVDNNEDAFKKEFWREYLDWANPRDTLGPEGAQARFDEGELASIQIPGRWEDAGYDQLDGIVWLHRSFQLKSDWSDSSVQLQLGPVDDIDTTWLNGVKLGSTIGPRADRNYEIPAGTLKVGENRLLVRVVDSGGGGGIWNPKQPPTLLTKDPQPLHLDLSGPWEIVVGFDLATTSDSPPRRSMPRYKNSPGVLFNGMIAPIIPYTIRGAIWYQGESNRSNPDEYRALFPTMIADWRARWGLDDFPFLYVQIAPYRDMPPAIREAQRLTLARTANTAMVVTTDIGDANDIHPTNKEPVGERLALAARALAYGEPIVHSGPLYKTVQFEGKKARLSFDSVGPGLISGDGEALRGFEIAASDGIYHPADARIVSNEIILSSENVQKPVAARYGWSDVPDVNLFNKSGLPASPFRTDSSR